MSGNAAARLKQLLWEHTLIGDELGIAKMIVFVGTFKDRNDTRIEKRERDKDQQQAGEYPIITRSE